MTQRSLFRVTTKAVIFNPDKTKVLTIYMPWNDDWGLPGGHLENGETPDKTIQRELDEECGVYCECLKREDFFMHRDGKVVLAFSGVASSEEVSLGQKDEGQPRWLTKKEFANISIEPNYKGLVLRLWL